MDKSKPAADVPSELTRQSKFDWAATELGKKIGGGAVLCGLAGFVLFRGPMLRVALTSFGSGFGGGWAYKVISDEFAKP